VISFEADQRPRQGIGIAPLIDIVFLLLIFFMLATSFAEDESIELGLPGPATTALPDPPPPSPDETLVVAVRPDGRITLNGLRLGIDQLDRELMGRLAGRPGLGVTVSADTEVPVQTLISVMDRVRGAGVVDINLTVGSDGAAAP